MRIFLSAAALNQAAVFAYANYQGDLRTECTRDRRLPQRVTAQWDKRLDAASFESSDNGKQRNWLHLAQRLWIQYRDSNCLSYDLGDGTLRCWITHDSANELMNGIAGSQQSRQRGLRL